MTSSCARALRVLATPWNRREALCLAWKHPSTQQQKRLNWALAHVGKRFGWWASLLSVLPEAVLQSLLPWRMPDVRFS